MRSNKHIKRGSLIGVDLLMIDEQLFKNSSHQIGFARYQGNLNCGTIYRLMNFFTTKANTSTGETGSGSAHSKSLLLIVIFEVICMTVAALNEHAVLDGVDGGSSRRVLVHLHPKGGPLINVYLLDQAAKEFYIKFNECLASPSVLLVATVNTKHKMEQRQMQDLKSKSTEELKAFIEISCTTSPNHLVSVRKVYCLLLDSSLPEYTVDSEEAQLHKYDGIFGFTKETIKRKGDEDRKKTYRRVKERTFDKSCALSWLISAENIRKGDTGPSQKSMENEMVVEAFKKLQNPYEVSTLLCLGAARARSIVAQTCALIFFHNSVATGGGWRNNRGPNYFEIDLDMHKFNLYRKIENVSGIGSRMRSYFLV
ncbi:hypothetical protein IGI04_030210 [Brassica rapa subsp. trilocularis]|uniref:Uncharacterized protein n=1 Tax=Brassica rapa subsp. trilocularis TaxID=1813537 RepID=A0ABQ7LQ16_BRACM|nr:hypothetical protein IGI04_030210 [Brassica rapa subsp. trilocularis]